MVLNNISKFKYSYYSFQYFLMKIFESAQMMIWQYFLCGFQQYQYFQITSLAGVHQTLTLMIFNIFENRYKFMSN